jgi:lipoyl(octanoyl) transferase
MEQLLRVRYLGRRDYPSVWREMQAFTEGRTSSSPDEAWLVEHPPVFTVGLNGRPEHLLAPGEIPIVHVDRGGQVTYHGPGQAVLYLLVDLRRRGLGVRHFVTAMEETVIAVLAQNALVAHARPEAPGVYVGEAKIAALGLRVRRGCTYHGLALNVDMDLAPFTRINPCGYAGMAVTSLAKMGINLSLADAGEALLRQFSQREHYRVELVTS